MTAVDRLFDVSEAEGGGAAGVPPARMPLAARMRPRSLEELCGQAEVLGPGSTLRALLERGRVPSLVLWGPPGSGKTSLAAVLAARTDAAFRELSAVSAGVRQVRRILEEAGARLSTSGRPTILFLDEIHRFTKAQQDALLPGVESGRITLVGATTENPFFDLTAPLLSRCELVRFAPLDREDLRAILRRALADPDRGYGGRVELTGEAEEELLRTADGDARAVLNALEAAVRAAGVEEEGIARMDREAVGSAVRRWRYDRAGDAHYDQISAFIKSLRGSDPDAAVYWLLRMLRSGEDPRFITRRMVIFASEDVGLADPGALPLAVAVFDAVERVGLPEARYNLVQGAVALATAPKSNAVARALSAGTAAVEEAGNAPVPAHLRDSHYAGARRLGHGAGYQYPHAHDDAFVVQQHLPDTLEGRRLYEPTRHGAERAVADRLAAWRRRQAARQEAHPVAEPGTAGDPEPGHPEPGDPGTGGPPASPGGEGGRQTPSEGSTA